MDYYFDKTGRKATMYRELGKLAKEESVLNKVPKKIDNFNSVINDNQETTDIFLNRF